MHADLTTLNTQAIAAAKQHMGKIAWPTIALAFATVSAFIVTLSLFAYGILNAWITLPIIAVLTYFSYTPLHEAAHGNIHGSDDSLRWINDLCGYIVAPIISVPYQSHRHEHFTHHRYTNQPDKDPDFIVSGMQNGFFNAIKTVFKFLWTQNTFFIRYQWVKASAKDRSIFAIELFISISWRVAYIALVDQPGTALVVLLGFIIGGWFTAYWFAYRPHLPYQQTERYRNTSSLIAPRWLKPIEWFWLGQNLHSIHHLFPKVPFYRYHALHREIEPAMRAHGTPIIGIFSREPQNPRSL